MTILTIDQPRSYDHGAGDRRFYDRDRAFTHANREAVKTGVRQQVRRDRGTLEEDLWVVQAVR